VGAVVGAAVLGGGAAWTVANKIHDTVVVKTTFDETQLLGDWQWHYPKDGWEGTVSFRPGTTGLLVDGKVDKIDVEPHKILYRWQNGTARLVNDGRELKLECDNVEDYQNVDRFGKPRRIVWNTTSPLKRDYSFVGYLNGAEKDGTPIQGHWGLTLYRPGP
jgi:hypothetical protein